MHGNAKSEAFAEMRFVHENVYTVVNMIVVKYVGDMITVHVANFLNRRMYVMCVNEEENAKLIALTT